MHIITPTVDVINKYITKFNNDERYYLADKAITKLYQEFPANTDFDNVLLKISVLNDLYSTNIFSVFRLAKHILSLNIDAELSQGSPLVVNRIATGHGIMSNRNNRELNFYSFSSKYCNWHNLNAYPIYDRFVEKILMAYKKRDKFHSFDKSDLKIYPAFLEIIKSFIAYYKLSSKNIKEVDKFLWIYGKEKFPTKYY